MYVLVHNHHRNDSRAPKENENEKTRPRRRFNVQITKQDGTRARTKVEHLLATRPGLTTAQKQKRENKEDQATRPKDSRFCTKRRGRTSNRDPKEHTAQRAQKPACVGETTLRELDTEGEEEAAGKGKELHQLPIVVIVWLIRSVANDITFGVAMISDDLLLLRMFTIYICSMYGFYE